MRVRQGSLAGVLVVVLVVAACTGMPSDRRSQVNQLTQQIRTMPGVVDATSTFNDDAPRGPAYFELDVSVADGITGDQLAAIASRYLDNLQVGSYRGYGAELDVRHGGNVFLLDSGGQAVINGDQVIAQARSWVTLRQEFPAGSVGLRATVIHAGDAKGAPLSGNIGLHDTEDYSAVSAAVGKLATAFPDLVAGDWTISAGKQRPAEIRTSHRLPNTQEMELWNTLNADQSIPHADVFTINGAVTGPLWVSEKIQAEDVDMALRLAAQHLPIVAPLPAPVLYSATNQYQGHIGFHGQATGPVTVLIGGCMKRDYRPTPAEQALIDRYETCRR